MRNKLIIYELNELPRRLLEYYVQLKPDSNFSRLKKIGKDLDTYTTDKGELHPWTTWPTFYRGVDNRLHGITSINQFIENEKKYPPIWKVLIKKNISIGIFGSLQSYPPIIEKNVKFYLPDTFSPNYDAYPKNLEKYQKFNLRLVSKNSGEIRPLNIIDFKNFIECIINSTIRLSSVLKILIQIIREKIRKIYKKRRSLLQPELSFDIYLRNLKKYKPDFSTFFTNHLAGMMHYYWYDIFPKDFKKQDRIPNEFNKNSIIKALDIADKQIGYLMDFAKENSYQLWIASSMGQEAIERIDYPRIFIKDFKKLINFLNFDPKIFNKLPSMYPDENIESNTEENINNLIKEFQEIRFLNNERIFNVRYRNNINKVNFILNTNLQKDKFLIYKNKKYDIKDLGLEYGSKKKGTGYHIPKGILITHGKASKKILRNKKKLDTKEVFSIILKVFDLQKFYSTIK